MEWRRENEVEWVEDEGYEYGVDGEEEMQRDGNE